MSAQQFRKWDLSNSESNDGLPWPFACSCEIAWGVAARDALTRRRCISFNPTINTESNPMNSQTSNSAKAVPTVLIWALHDLPEIKQRLAQIQRPKAELDRVKARINDVGADFENHRAKVAAVEKKKAAAVQRWIVQPDYVYLDEAADASELATSQAAMLAAEAKLAALQAALTSNVANEELADAEAAYASACEAAKRERETFHRQRVVERLSTALVDGYAEQLNEGFISANAKDPLGIIMGMLDKATFNRCLLNAVQVKHLNRYGEA